MTKNELAEAVSMLGRESVVRAYDREAKVMYDIVSYDLLIAPGKETATLNLVRVSEEDE